MTKVKCPPKHSKNSEQLRLHLIGYNNETIPDYSIKSPNNEGVGKTRVNYK